MKEEGIKKLRLDEFQIRPISIFSEPLPHVGVGVCGRHVIIEIG